MPSTLASVAVSLYLVRHGETQGNYEQKVVGQGDSPLTRRGIEQSKALGRTRWMQDTTFWRIYSSDIARARETAELVLDNANQINADCRYDKRLRETSKGARQGLPKRLTYHEALETRQKLGMTGPIPLLESEEDGWNRIKEWLDEVIEDAVNDVSEDDADSLSTRHRNILVFGHAGIFRIFLTRLLGAERLRQHPESNYDPLDSRFAIPNTSLTILRIQPILYDDQVVAKPQDITSDQIEIIELTSHGHIQQLERTARKDLVNT